MSENVTIPDVEKLMDLVRLNDEIAEMHRMEEMQEIFGDWLSMIQEGSWIEVLFGFDKDQVRDRGLVVHKFVDGRAETMVIVFEKNSMIYGPIFIGGEHGEPTDPDVLLLNPSNWEDWPEHGDMLMMLQIQHESMLNPEWEGGVFRIVAINGKELEKEVTIEEHEDENA